MEVADDAWASLLPDLLLDIFRLLQATAVIRCAAACKPWRRAIIGNASSLRLRPDRFNPNLLLGFFHLSWDDDDDDDDGVVNASSAPPPAIMSVTDVDNGHRRSLSSLVPASFAGGVDLSSSSRRILASRDGFVLLVISRGPKRYELCLCNTMARACTFFPLPSMVEDCDFALLSCYDGSAHGSLRVLAKAGTLTLCTKENRLTYQVFACGSNGTGTWGPVQRSGEVDKGLQMATYGWYGNKAVVAGDAVYWLAGPKSSAGLITCTVGLDICTGRAWVTKLPSHCEFFQISTTMYVLTMSDDGGLSLLQSVPDHNRHIQMWVLDGDRDAMEWTVQRKISIHVPKHPDDENPGFLFFNVVCPRSGFLLNVLSSGRQQCISLDSSASQPVQHIAKRGKYETNYYPYEMDWSTYISNMKNFVNTATTATVGLEGSVVDVAQANHHAIVQAEHGLLRRGVRDRRPNKRVHGPEWA